MDWFRSILPGGNAGGEEQREILLNRLQSRKYCSNRISTAKYNLASFLPRFLFESFRRFANLYFLMIALLQQIPGVSPTGRLTTAVPLLFILTLSAVKEIIEDLRRHRADRRVNRTAVLVLRGGNWTEIRWEDVVVGDLVKVVTGQFFPADLILLSSSEPNGLAYVETANLDGETNLKIRQGLTATAAVLSHHDLYQLRGAVDCQAPNNHLYDITANIRLGEAEAIPIHPDQLLQRGAQLRNTKWIFGLVIYTGHETKLMKNSSTTPLKRYIVYINQLLQQLSPLCSIAALMWTS